MPYRVWATNDIPSAADMNAITADSIQADITASDSTTSLTFVALATPGPSLNITLVLNQGCFIIVRSTMINQTSLGGAFHGWAVSGAESDPATTMDAAHSRNIERVAIESTSWYAAGTSGTHTVTSLYRIEASGTALFERRRLNAKKF